MLDQWPEEGPPLLWRAQGIGLGFATVAIVGQRIYTAGNVGDSTVISALDYSGRLLWQAKNGPAYERSHPGARATPTLNEGKLYHLNADGDVVCLEAETGRRLWSLNMLERFNGRNIRWALSESLLVDGRRLICYPGGETISMVALDKHTGETIWTCTGVGDAPGYASPRVVDYGGLRQIVTMTARAAIGVEAESGRLLWRFEQEAPYDVNCNTPLYHDGHLYLFRTWGRGATKLKLVVKGDQCSVEQVWHTQDLDNEHGGVALVNGYLYGQADGNHRQRYLACLEATTGRTMWTDTRLAGRGSASLTLADGMLYVVSDRGEVGLVRPNPKQLEIVSQFQVPPGGEGPLYAHPVVHDGRLYVRHGDFLYAYDIARR